MNTNIDDIIQNMNDIIDQIYNRANEIEDMINRIDKTKRSEIEKSKLLHIEKIEKSVNDAKKTIKLWKDTYEDYRSLF